jgi:hypothetical protein
MEDFKEQPAKTTPNALNQIVSRHRIKTEEDAPGKNGNKSGRTAGRNMSTAPSERDRNSYPG